MIHMILVNPMREAAPEAGKPAPRLQSLAGRTVALLDISKPGGSVFLDRLAALLMEREGVAAVPRFRKPTFAKVAPADVIDALIAAHPDAAIEALAD
jgi:hypothetical protein